MATNSPTRDIPRFTRTLNLKCCRLQALYRLGCIARDLKVQDPLSVPAKQTSDFHCRYSGRIPLRSEWKSMGAEDARFEAEPTSLCHFTSIMHLTTRSARVSACVCALACRQFPYITMRTEFHRIYWMGDYGWRMLAVNYSNQTSLQDERSS